MKEFKIYLLQFLSKKTFLGLLKVKELPCIPIPKPPNGDITYSDSSSNVYASSTTASLACNLGFVPVGPMETTCKNGRKLIEIAIPLRKMEI